MSTVIFSGGTKRVRKRDDDVVPFYERLGGVRINAVVWRNRDRLNLDATTH
jgi:hypothetical protein